MPHPENWPVIFFLDCISSNPTVWRLWIPPPPTTEVINSVERREKFLLSMSLWRTKCVFVHRVERNDWKKVFLKVFTAKSPTKTSTTHSIEGVIGYTSILSQQIGAKSVLNFSAASGSMPLQFAKGMMKDAQVGKQSLGRDRKLWHQLNGNLKSSPRGWQLLCSHQPRVFSETCSCREERSNPGTGKSLTDQGHTRLSNRYIYP